MPQVHSPIPGQLLVFVAIVFAVNVKGKSNEGLANDNGEFDSSTETQNKQKVGVFHNILRSLSKKGKRCLLIFGCLRIFNPYLKFVIKNFFFTF